MTLNPYKLSLGKLVVQSHSKKVFEQQEKIGSNTQKEYTSPREAQIGLQQSDSIPEGLSKILEHFNRLSLPSALHSLVPCTARARAEDC